MTPTGALPRGGAGLADASTAASVDPTVWGLTPVQLHDRFWASRGVQIVRAGASEEPISPQAPLYLLMEPGALALFDLPEASRKTDVDLLYVRIHDARDRGLRERVVTDAQNRFVRFERLYDRPRSRLARAALTRSADVAAVWKASDDWKALRQKVRKAGRSSVERRGMWFDGHHRREVAAFVRELTRCWSDPSQAVGRANRLSDGVWRDRDAVVHPSARLVGPVWIGCGREPDAETMVVRPSILWDDPAHRPAAEPFSWESVSRNLPADHFGGPALRHAPHSKPVYLAMKRVFDLAFSLVALCLTLPFYPFILLAIVVEDGRPVFFKHRRETIGGREFACLKFRSMRRDAEAMKSVLRARNQADGPQFYIDDDPRLTRVGKLLRRYRVDEWPQFMNVLAGQMSIVGPRPSPFRENQFCPDWRQLRLSVRPGITGLWQVARTRAPGADFQEWIRYDIEYVETACWSVDLHILWRTLRAVLMHRSS